MVYELALWTRHSRHSDSSVTVSDAHESQSVHRHAEMTDSHTLSLPASAAARRRLRLRRIDSGGEACVSQAALGTVCSEVVGWVGSHRWFMSRHCFTQSPMRVRVVVGVVTRD
ncbi:hypothetical protein NDU88_003774 [Pleurodeles waltl]|uniref:Uncharacterized protein n=1 Tax=Pleurodeles waltl TaxID=8319 RepID=A0AAV7TQN2_PLEWA|nr:hypothetical protein NDU88_003774 [Pleurodeles waltl]